MAHVLVVEDDDLMWLAYERWLTQQGHSAAWVSSVPQARGYIVRELMGKEPRMHAAIIDLELGGSMGGLEVIAELPKRVQPIVISGHPIDYVRTRVEYPLRRVNVFFGKPMAAAEDWERLRTVIERASKG